MGLFSKKKEARAYVRADRKATPMYTVSPSSGRTRTQKMMHCIRSGLGSFCKSDPPDRILKVNSKLQNEAKRGGHPHAGERRSRGPYSQVGAPRAHGRDRGGAANRFSARQPSRANSKGTSESTPRL